MCSCCTSVDNIAVSEPLYLSSCERFLQVHRCSGDDVLLGNANISGSIFTLLLIGWLVGIATGAGATMWWRKRRAYPPVLHAVHPSVNTPGAPVSLLSSLHGLLSCHPVLLSSTSAKHV